MDVLSVDQTCGYTATSGRIKWFNTTKDYGFIVPSDGGLDILLRGCVLRNFGQSSILEGTEVVVAVEHGEQGLQAFEIVSLTPPEQPDLGDASDIEDLLDIDLESMPLLPARVKWYDSAKGFGFAQLFGDADDIFLHNTVLRKAGLSDLMSGEAVCIRWGVSDRGKIAFEVSSWLQHE